ncbi:MFS transporter [Lactobacillus sp. Sy-1]|uniref:MFS transporter n=1 Tax=Lactobacillus sp. Sy-1 TaxID=2109645 RepID=UPI001C5A9CCA|nr:MFS transporter [Lactobacillus sp. Sy-1]MBW1606333.1 MFS transporter [Lactobacillus sp. Sy-1]
MNNYFRRKYPLLFTNKNFDKLLLATVLSEMGNQMQRFGIPWLIFHITNSGSLMALNFSLSLIPGVFFGFIGGLISDRVSRKKMLLYINISAFIIISMIMVLLQFENNISVIFIFILTFIISSLTSMYEPTFNASLPVIVPKDKLISMNNIFNIVGSLIGLLGPSIAGLIIGVYGAWMCIFINGISYLLSFVVILLIKSDLSILNNKKDSIRNDIASVKNYIYQNSWFLFCLLITAAVYLATGSIGSVLQYLFLHYLHLSGFMFGFTFVLFEFIPVLCVGLFSSSIIKKFDSLLIIQVSAALFCISLIGMGLSLNYFLIVLMGMLQNASFALLMIAWNSKRQSQIPNNILGKINGGIVTIQSILLPIGALSSTALINFISVPKIIIIFGTISLVFVLLLILIKRTMNRKSALQH